MKRPTIEDAKRLAKRDGLKGCIIIGFTEDDQLPMVSYGKDRAHCQCFGKVLDRIGEDLSSGVIPVDLP